MHEASGSEPHTKLQPGSWTAACHMLHVACPSCMLHAARCMLHEACSVLRSHIATCGLPLPGCTSMAIHVIALARSTQIPAHMVASPRPHGLRPHSLRLFPSQAPAPSAPRGRLHATPSHGETVAVVRASFSRRPAAVVAAVYARRRLQRFGAALEPWASLWVARLSARRTWVLGDPRLHEPVRRPNARACNGDNNKGHGVRPRGGFIKS